MTTLPVPDLCLVVLIGASSAGKSTFAARAFQPGEVVSSDAMRALVAGDENAQEASADAFELLHLVVGKRLARGLLTVVDATSLRPEHRAPLVKLAKAHHVPAVALVLDLPERLLKERHHARADRRFPVGVIHAQVQQLRQGARKLADEGFRFVHRLATPEEVDAATIARVRRDTDLRHLAGPFDLVGDVHGCRAELDALLGALGWEVCGDDATHPEGRTLVFLGDLVDRGPDSPGVLRLAMTLVRAGRALLVPGNHDAKLVKALRGQKVTRSHGLQGTLDQLAPLGDAFGAEVAAFLDAPPSHCLLDGGRLAVAHAGVTEELQNRASAKVRAFCLYGETTGETDGYGLPVRGDWASRYAGKAKVVYGHVPTTEARWRNGTICLDTGCVFGGRLTALRWPEEVLVSVPATAQHWVPARPLAAPPEPAADLVDVTALTGDRRLATRYVPEVAVSAAASAGALESLCRFAVSPRWLLTLPPTMSPPDAAPAGSEVLERPEEALALFRADGVSDVVLEEKHMGSRALLVVCRHPGVGPARFGADPRPGVIYTRTGRPFFRDPALADALLARVAAAFERAGLWDELATDWVVLDAELMPWSAKARELLRAQYEPTGAAGVRALSAAAALLARTPGAEALRARTEARLDAVRRFDAVWRRYSWATDGLEGLRLAPFHLLASEGHVHVDRDHGWHLATLARAVDPLIVATRHVRLSLADPGAGAAADAFFGSLVADGGEGMVVKPWTFLHRDAKGRLGQPAIKVRGAEYLRLVYGPEYPLHLERLRARGLGRKRNLALRELSLGLEALHAVVERAPLERVHALVSGVLALESEPVDPRL